jgi:hypothetical protein
MNALQKPGSSFKEIKDIGVIWVTDEAARLGYYSGHPEWANLGQGEPEVGEMPGAPPRIKSFVIEPGDDRYGPLNGMATLREAIAAHYNRLYRKDKQYKYVAENVGIAMGGRLALSQVCSILGNVRLGYKVPEYPAYEDIINSQCPRITPVRIATKKANNYALPSSELERAIIEHRLNTFLMSNPCNPTGHVVKGDELAAYVHIGRKQRCALILDEFYSHFIYAPDMGAGGPVSAAAYIDDVNEDQVLIIDGLTKSFRYPGWRLAWVLGPTAIIADMGRAASGLDGGPSMPVQRAALPLFEPGRADMETHALREVFGRKQQIALQSLRANGMICNADANSTFYIWADISRLPAPLNEARTFFNELLKRKVMVVPGYMFDIHPGREAADTHFDQYVRISFGPEEENLKMGLRRITELIQQYS